MLPILVRAGRFESTYAAPNTIHLVYTLKRKVIMAKRILVPWKIMEIGKRHLDQSGAEIVMFHGPNGELLDTQEIVEQTRDADVVLSCGGVPIPAEVLTANPNLRGVANNGVGFNNIDIETATQLGIPVSNTPGVLTDTTADLTWALLMAAARQIPQAHQYIVDGHWQGYGGKDFMGLDIGPGGSNRPKVLGIIGFGRIGQGVMRRSQGFEMVVRAYDPPMKPIIDNTDGVEHCELDDLLKESDFVTLHCPLTDQTHHLISQRELELMKPTAVLVNASRGPVVDEAALVTALREGQIAAAGLDVFEREPTLTAGLTELENVVMLPHIGSASTDTREQMSLLAAKNAVIMLQGNPPEQIVNPEVLKMSEYQQRLK